MLWHAAEIAELLDGMAKVTALGNVREPLACHRIRTAHESITGAKLRRLCTPTKFEMLEHHHLLVRAQIAAHLLKVPDQVVRSINALVDSVSEFMVLRSQKVCQFWAATKSGNENSR